MTISATRLFPSTREPVEACASAVHRPPAGENSRVKFVSIQMAPKGGLELRTFNFDSGQLDSLFFQESGECLIHNSYVV
ncbi:MAG: hypothetical protein OEM42_06200, partial [Deltaproteobacteria bacterium]|nr:hypothetical protein [Deltaproteobacteria bacterium]